MFASTPSAVAAAVGSGHFGGVMINTHYWKQTQAPWTTFSQMTFMKQQEQSGRSEANGQGHPLSDASAALLHHYHNAQEFSYVRIPTPQAWGLFGFVGFLDWQQEVVYTARERLTPVLLYSIRHGRFLAALASQRNFYDAVLCNSVAEYLIAAEWVYDTMSYVSTPTAPPSPPGQFEDRPPTQTSPSEVCLGQPAGRGDLEGNHAACLPTRAKRRQRRKPTSVCHLQDPHQEAVSPTQEGSISAQNDPEPVCQDMPALSNTEHCSVFSDLATPSSDVGRPTHTAAEVANSGDVDGTRDCHEDVGGGDDGGWCCVGQRTRAKEDGPTAERSRRGGDATPVSVLANRFEILGAVRQEQSEQATVGAPATMRSVDRTTKTPRGDLPRNKLERRESLKTKRRHDVCPSLQSVEDTHRPASQPETRPVLGDFGGGEMPTDDLFAAATQHATMELASRQRLFWAVHAPQHRQAYVIPTWATSSTTTTTLAAEGGDLVATSHPRIVETRDSWRGYVVHTNIDEAVATWLGELRTQASSSSSEVAWLRHACQVGLRLDTNSAGGDSDAPMATPVACWVRLSTTLKNAWNRMHVEGELDVARQRSVGLRLLRRAWLMMRGQHTRKVAGWSPPPTYAKVSAEPTLVDGVSGVKPPPCVLINSTLPEDDDEQPLWVDHTDNHHVGQPRPFEILLPQHTRGRLVPMGWEMEAPTEHEVQLWGRAIQDGQWTMQAEVDTFNALYGGCFLPRAGRRIMDLWHHELRFWVVMNSCCPMTDRPHQCQPRVFAWEHDVAPDTDCVGVAWLSPTEGSWCGEQVGDSQRTACKSLETPTAERVVFLFWHAARRECLCTVLDGSRVCPKVVASCRSMLELWRSLCPSEFARQRVLSPPNCVVAMLLQACVTSESNVEHCNLCMWHAE